MATKKTKSGAKTNTKRKNQSAVAQAKQQEKSEQILAIILFALGILFAALIIIPGENAWRAAHNFIRGLFGIIVFIIPMLLIYLGVRGASKTFSGRLQNKLLASLFLLLLLCSFWQLLFVGEFLGGNFANMVNNLYLDGIELKNGGVFSIALGVPLLYATGRVAAVVILLLVTFVFVLFITGTTLLEAFHALKKPIQALGQRFDDRRLEKEIQQEKFSIDVDLGPDTLPNHPVSSSRVAFERTSNPSMADRFEEIVRQTGGIEGGEQQPSAVETPVEDAPEPYPGTTLEPTLGPALKTESTEIDPKGQSPKSELPLDDLVKKAAAPILAPTANKAFEPNITIAGQTPQYRYPPVTLLKAAVNKKNKDLSEELRANAERLVDTLKSFGVQTRVVDISRGPTVTRYELQPSAGVKISRITGLSDDIAMNLATAGVRIEAPIPNKAAVGIEVPNRETDIVTIREIVDSKAFRSAESRLSVALGRDISGREVVFDIAKMPHMLIAGATGSGKSVCINTLIMSVIFKASPEEVRLLMIDPKVVELGIYNGIPHLLVPVVTDPRKAAGALGWAVSEMLKRYKLFADNQVRDLNGYNQLAKANEQMSPLPQIILIIDELADLMMAAPNEVEDAICRLAQMARAAGMHLVIATQRPSVDVITGVIKANIPSRIAFSVSSQVDSRTIIDSAGAEKLLGRGDMLFYPVGTPKPTRLQCCYVSDTEVEAVVQFIKSSEMAAEYDDNIMDEIEKQTVQPKGKGKNASNAGGGVEQDDPLLSQAMDCLLEVGQASTSYLQRRLKVGYARAARLMDEMEEKGLIGPPDGSKPRAVLISREAWMERKLRKHESS